jgi:hypothetical protein
MNEREGDCIWDISGKNQKEGDNWEVQDVDGWAILKWNSER